jgi:hypothetical protein
VLTRKLKLDVGEDVSLDPTERLRAREHREQVARSIASAATDLQDGSSLEALEDRSSRHLAVQVLKRVRVRRAVPELE